MPVNFPSSSTLRMSPSLSSRSSSDSLTGTETEVDDSLPLSDLIFAGEQSRLRRRGAVYHHNIHARGSSSGTSLEEPSSPTSYTLFCGGVVTNPSSPMQTASPSTPFFPSPLPWSDPSPTRSLHGAPDNSSNGCGAIIRTGAIPSLGTTMFISKARNAEQPPVLVHLPDHFVRDSEVEFKERLGANPSCGCARHVIACAACGNILGTRYVPCPEASLDAFIPFPSSPNPPSMGDVSYYRPQAYGSFSSDIAEDASGEETSESDSNSSTPTIRPGPIASSYCLYSFLPSQVTSFPPYEFPESPPRRRFLDLDEDRDILERARGPNVFLQRGGSSDTPVIRYRDSGAPSRVIIQSEAAVEGMQSRSTLSSTSDNLEDGTMASPVPLSAPIDTPLSTSPMRSRELSPALGTLTPRSSTPHPANSTYQAPLSISRLFTQTPSVASDSSSHLPLSNIRDTLPRFDSLEQPAPPAPRIPHLEPDPNVISQNRVLRGFGVGDTNDDNSSGPGLIPDIPWIPSPQQMVALPHLTSEPILRATEFSEGRDTGLELFFRIFLSLRQRSRDHTAAAESRWSREAEPSTTRDFPSPSVGASQSPLSGEEEDKEWWQGLDLDADGDPCPPPLPPPTR